MELNLYLYSFGLCVGETDLAQSRAMEVATVEVSHTANGRTGRSLALPSQSLQWWVPGAARAVGTCPLCWLPPECLHMSWPAAPSCPPAVGTRSGAFRCQDYSKIQLSHLGDLFSPGGISSLFTIVECVPWDVKTHVWYNPGFV